MVLMEEGLYHKFAEVEDVHWWFVGRRAILVDQIGQYVRFADRLLDVGCGTGGNMEALSEIYRVQGIDDSAVAIEYCWERDLFTALHTSIESVPSNNFHGVMMLDVVEHVDDDIGLLKEARRILLPSGKLFITVPAYQWMWSTHDEINGHQRRYTAKILRRVLELAGFKVEEVSYFNCLLFPAAALQRFLAPNADGLNVPKLNRLLLKIFLLEKYLLRHISLPFGLSILAVASKEAA